MQNLWVCSLAEHLCVNKKDHNSLHPFRDQIKSSQRASFRGTSQDSFQDSGRVSVPVVEDAREPYVIVSTPAAANCSLPSRHSLQLKPEENQVFRHCF